MTALNRSSPAVLVSTSNMTDDILNNRSGGVVAYQAVTQNSGLFGPQEATITGFDTGPIVTYDNRIYRISYQLALQATPYDPADTSIGQMARIWLTDGDNNHLCYVDTPRFMFFINENLCLARTYLDVDPGGGTRRYKLRGEQTFNLAPESLCFAACDTSIPGWIMVEDVGPSTGYS